MTATPTPSTAASPELNLAPSDVHWRLMQQPRPLSYDGGDVAAWQRKLRRRLRAIIGYDRMPRTKCSLNVRRLWRREHELGTIEKLIYTAEPGADVPCYLCLPRGVKPPSPVFICLQGHSTGMHNSIGVSREDEATPITVAGDRDFGLGCMRRGVAALCIEQRAFGQRAETKQKAKWDHTCIDATMHALMLGRTMIAERVYDVARGIDALRRLHRDDRATYGFDFRRLGVMGNSGGGTVTIFAAALLRDVKLAMPSCSFCHYRACVMRINHCPDNYAPGLLAHAEAADVMGLFAPRPVVIVAGEHDEIFPIAGVHGAFADLQRIYRAAGAENHCQLVVGDEGHRFYADAAWPVMEQYL